MHVAGKDGQVKGVCHASSISAMKIKKSSLLNISEEKWADDHTQCINVCLCRLPCKDAADITILGCQFGDGEWFLLLSLLN